MIAFLILGVMATISAVYCVKASAIRDYALNSTARAYGESSWIYKIQRAFIGNVAYLLAFRLASGTISVLILGFLIVSILSNPHLK